MHLTTPVAPRVRRFIPFGNNKNEVDNDAGQKDVGQKDGAPQATPSREFLLMSGEETTDPLMAVRWSGHRQMPRGTQRGRPCTKGELS